MTAPTRREENMIPIVPSPIIAVPQPSWCETHGCECPCHDEAGSLWPSRVIVVVCTLVSLWALTEIVALVTAKP